MTSSDLQPLPRPLQPPKPGESKGSLRSVNMAAAFARYARGWTIEAIADTLGVDRRQLHRRAVDERWGELLVDIKRLPDVPDKTKKDAVRVEANREKNYELFAQLRDELVAQATLMAKGELKFTRVKVTKNGPTEVEEPADMQDRVRLAQAARLVTEGTYRALGDLAAIGADEKQRRGLEAPTHITILLPGVVMDRPTKPAVGGEVIDLGPAPALPDSADDADASSPL